MSNSGILLNRNGINGSTSDDYDSRIPVLSIDMEDPLKHADVIELRGGTVWTEAAGVYNSWSEVIWEKRHGLKFKPKVLSYYYVIDAPARSATPILSIGQYYPNVLQAPSGIPYGSEYWTTEADEEFIRIRHTGSQFSSTSPGFNGAYLGLGNDVKFRFKYLITQSPDIAV